MSKGIELASSKMMARLHRLPRILLATNSIHVQKPCFASRAAAELAIVLRVFAAGALQQAAGCARTFVPLTEALALKSTGLRLHTSYHEFANGSGVLEMDTGFYMGSCCGRVFSAMFRLHGLRARYFYIGNFSIRMNTSLDQDFPSDVTRQNCRLWEDNRLQWNRYFEGSSLLLFPCPLVISLRDVAFVEGMC